MPRDPDMPTTTRRSRSRSTLIYALAVMLMVNLSVLGLLLSGDLAPAEAEPGGFTDRSAPRDDQAGPAADAPRPPQPADAQPAAPQAPAPKPAVAVISIPLPPAPAPTPMVTPTPAQLGGPKPSVTTAQTTPAPDEPAATPERDNAPTFFGIVAE